MLEHIWDPRTARVLFTTLIFVIVLVFLHDTKGTLTLFLFAILFAYFVDPLVSRLQKPLRGRGKAIGAVYFILIGLLVGLGFLVGPSIADEAKSLSQSLPSLFNRLSSGELFSQFGRNHGWSYLRVQQLQEFFVSHRNDMLHYAQVIGGKLESPVSHAWWLILIPILSLFFLKNGQQIAGNLVELGRDPYEKATLSGIVEDVNVMLGSYIRSQLILASLTLVSYTLVLSLMRVPYAFILGPLAGMCEFVPVVGPAVAAVSVFAIAILSGYTHLLWLFLFLGAWRLLQDYVNAPRIMGKSLEISPLAQIFGVLAGGEIGGVVGALISVPVIAIMRILWRRMSSPQTPDAPATPDLPANSAAH
jgi:predicted PurR-regulated permease PerM